MQSLIELDFYEDICPLQEDAEELMGSIVCKNFEVMRNDTHFRIYFEYSPEVVGLEHGVAYNSKITLQENALLARIEKEFVPADYDAEYFMLWVSW